MKADYYFPLLFLALVIVTCESPADGFKRSNSNDPQSPDYIGGAEFDLKVIADKSGIITIQWAESEDFVTKNVIEKSLGDTLSFTVLGELDPNIRHYTDSTLNVRDNTYYRLSSYSGSHDKNEILFNSSMTVCALPTTSCF